MNATSEKKRPCAFPLDADPSTEMKGRNGMFIHGCKPCEKNDFSNPIGGECSEGCVVINNYERALLRRGDKLTVKSEE